MAKLTEPEESENTRALDELREKNEEIALQRDRIKHLEQKQGIEFSRSQTEIAELRRKLESYEDIARRIVIFARNFSPQPLESSRSSFSAADDEYGSSKDIFVKEAIHFYIHYERSNRCASRISRISEGKIMQEKMFDYRTSVDVAFQILKTKIVEMENQLQHKMSDFQRLKTESGLNKQELQEANFKLHDLQRTIRNLEEVLQDQLKTGQSHLEEEKQQHKKKESIWKDEILTMENDLDEYRRRIEQLGIEKDNITSEKEILKSQFNSLEQRYSTIQQKSSENETTIREYQELIIVYKKSCPNAKPTPIDCSGRNDFQVESAEQEREQIRRELLDVRSKLTAATIKINNLKSVVNDLSSEKKVSLERIEVFEKGQRDSSLTNREKTKQLSNCKASDFL
uniref:Uncharacterized protein n=1 Tax=Ditylenchus dipsaci TaxID=166011 RepID=A0A915EHP2_9BILA